MEKTKIQIEHLKKIGYTQDKIDEVVKLLAPEIEEQVFTKFIDDTSEEELDTYKDRLVAVGSEEEYKKIFDEISQKVYGDSWKEKLDEMWAHAIEQIGDQTIQIRDTYQKYMSGDPNTMKKIKEIEDSQEFKDEVEQMEKDGFDFQKEASK